MYRLISIGLAALAVVVLTRRVGADTITVQSGVTYTRYTNPDPMQCSGWITIQNSPGSPTGSEQSVVVNWAWGPDPAVVLKPGDVFSVTCAISNITVREAGGSASVNSRTP